MDTDALAGRGRAGRANATTFEQPDDTLRASDFEASDPGAGADKRRSLPCDPRIWARLADPGSAWPGLRAWTLRCPRLSAAATPRPRAVGPDCPRADRRRCAGGGVIEIRSASAAPDRRYTERRRGRIPLRASADRPVRPAFTGCASGMS
jgi:hypothetical protein